MQALVINLDHAQVRLAFQEEQAKRLGLDLVRIPAVTAADVMPPPSDAIWGRWQRPLRLVEMATLLSHRLAWERVAAGSGPTLILEDDAWLMPQARPLLDRLTGVALDLDYVNLETRGRRKILGAPHPDRPGLNRLWLDRSGAAAYVLWPSGARKLLRRASSVPGLADAVISETADLIRWQAAPALAIQMDMASRYGLTAPIAVTSSISTVPRPGSSGWAFRLRRLRAQAAMAPHFLRLLTGARRVELRLP